MDNFDNNNMGGFEPQKPFTEKPVQNNSMNKIGRASCRERV